MSVSGFDISSFANAGTSSTPMSGQELDDAVIQARVLAIGRQRRSALWWSLGLMVFTVYLLRNEQPAWLLLAWLASNVCFALWRAVHWMRRPAAKVAAHDAHNWIRESALANGLNGLIWGIGGWAFLSHDNITNMVLLLLVLISLTCGAAVSLAANFHSVVAFCVPVTGLVALKMWTQNFEQAQLFAASTLLYLAFVLTVGRGYATAVTGALQLSIRNSQLLAITATQKAAVERVSLERSRFFAAVSHDLRQPVYALGLLLDALNRQLKTPEQRRLLGDAQRVRRALDELFSSLLDVAELDYEAYPVNARDFEIGALVESLAAEFLPGANTKGITVEASSGEHWVHSDRVLLSRILRNLLSNAIKFTDVGTVVLDTQLSEDKVIVNVSDSGCGIPAADHQHIFSEHVQLRNPQRDRANGLGLGLTVVKRLCEILGITITVDSIVGAGTRFQLEIPRGTDTYTSRADMWLKDDNFDGLHVLFLDDDVEVRRATSNMLSEYGCIVTSSAFVEDALEKLPATSRPVDIIVTDYHLSDEMSGIDAIGRVRAAVDPELPALVISADNDPATQARVGSAGLGMIAKPLSAHELRKAISELL